MKMRSVWAIVAGAVFVIIASTLVDVGLHAAGIYPSQGTPLDHRLSAIALSYRLVIGIAGGWIAARLAPEQPLTHALWLGYVGIVLGGIGAAATWNKGLGPHWYPLALVVAAVPQSWLGGLLFARSRGA